MIKLRPRIKLTLYIFLVLFIIPLFLSGHLSIPVKNAKPTDWNNDSFWYEPWGVSGVHKGIDIFAAKNTDIISPTPAIILFAGEIEIGGKVIISLGPKWRLHYFAHLQHISTHIGAFISTGETIGTVGDSGNAAGKQPHLHYSYLTLLPYIWNIDTSVQGWKKMFYLNPIEYLRP